MRFKDLLGRKPEPDESTGRLIGASATVRDKAGEPRDVDEAASGRGVGPVAPVHRSAPIAPAPRAAPDAPAALADLFTRLLAAEQGEPPPPPSSSPIRLSDADVERLAARVAARFAEAPLRDEVRQIVIEVSERLVREEIARIRHAAEAQQP